LSKKRQAETEEITAIHITEKSLLWEEEVRHKLFTIIFSSNGFFGDLVARKVNCDIVQPNHKGMPHGFAH
jgi:hypothetical protein